MRKSWSFRTLQVLELSLYHLFGNLPEPELTHDFLRRVEVSNHIDRMASSPAH